MSFLLGHNGLNTQRLALLLVVFCIASCAKQDSDATSDIPMGALKFGKYLVLDTRTDQGDPVVAKKNAENALRKYPDLDVMVGLWEYNAPQCLESAKDAGLEGKITIVSFDESDLTLQGIKDGFIEGTVVQQPYKFAYESMRYLKALSDGDVSVLPDSKFRYVDTRVIDKSNVDQFHTELLSLRENLDAPSVAGDDALRRFAFVVNLPNPFWSYARAGCIQAEKDFQIECVFKIPHDGSSAEQNKILENLIEQERVQGVAVSPLDPANQTDVLNRVASHVPLIAVDSDAPESDRKFYLGTDNYLGGRKVGQLIKRARPQGGKVMIFVGKLDVLNAQQRRQGVLDELAGKPLPE